MQLRALRERRARRLLHDLLGGCLSPKEFTVVLALARCGIYCDSPTEAYLHQMSRLVEVLPPEQAKSVQALLDWHYCGRAVSVSKLTQR